MVLDAVTHLGHSRGGCEASRDLSPVTLTEPGMFVKVGMEGPAFADVFVLPHMVPQEDHL